MGGVTSPMETIRNHHPSTSSGSIITSCEWMSVLLRQRQVSNKVNFLLIRVSEKLHFCVRMFGKYVFCEKWVQYVYW